SAGAKLRTTVRKSRGCSRVREPRRRTGSQDPYPTDKAAGWRRDGGPARPARLIFRGLAAGTGLTYTWQRMSFSRYILLMCCVLPASAATCESLGSLTLANTKIVAESRPAGSFTPSGGRPINGLPAFCRVSGSILPTPDSDIQFEVW